MADVARAHQYAARDGAGFHPIFFAQPRARRNAEGNFITDWETVLGGTYSTGTAVRWRTVRAWKSRIVIAERIEGLPSGEVVSHSMMHRSTLEREELRIFEEFALPVSILSRTQK